MIEEKEGRLNISLARTIGKPRLGVRFQAWSRKMTAAIFLLITKFLIWLTWVATDIPKIRRTLLQTIEKQILQHFRNIGRPYQLYAIAAMLISIAFFFFSMEWHIGLSSTALFAGIIIYGWGFALWLKPYLYEFRSSEIGNIAGKIAHAIVGVFSAVYARHVVADALQQLPQYFDLTVVLVGLIFYIPTYVALLSVLCTVFMVVTFIASSVALWIENSIRMYLTPWFGNTAKIEHISATAKRFSLKAFLHGFGALLMATFGAGVFVILFKFTPHMYFPIRQFAYLADFQPAGQYPGVPCDGKIRLEDNGIVAVAQASETGVQIRSVRFDDKVPLSAHCSAMSPKRNVP